MYSLHKTRLDFALLHFVLQGQTCLLFQVSLDFIHLYSNPLWWKGHVFFCLLVGFWYCYGRSFAGGSSGKESACDVGDLGSIPGVGRSSGGGHGNPFQYSCLEKPHGQRSLAGYIPWGCKELDMTERLYKHILGLVGLHRTFQLLRHHWMGHRFGLLWFWMVYLGNVLEIAPKYCILDSFVDYEGYSISSQGFLPM